jgi:hypothetical protein
MVPARPEKVLVEVWEQDEEWGKVPAWEPVAIVFAPNAAQKAPMPGECPAILSSAPNAAPPWFGDSAERKK